MVRDGGEKGYWRAGGCRDGELEMILTARPVRPFLSLHVSLTTNQLHYNISRHFHVQPYPPIRHSKTTGMIVLYRNTHILWPFQIK